MKSMALVLLLLLVIASTAGAALAGPILKPRKYYGPIPQSSLTVRAGFLGGASNAEMIEYLDGLILSSEEARSEDFGTEASFEVTYMHKPHPQFGLRANVSLTLLRTSGDGFFTIEGGPPRPVVEYERTFDVDLYALELSGVYFFSDASVKEFQSYAGGGFTFGFPRERFDEPRAFRPDSVSATLPPPEDVRGDQWSTLAGVHGVLGALYYITNRLAISAEARYQLLESKFPLKALDEDGRPTNVRFVVDYSGFYMALGVTRGF